MCYIIMLTIVFVREVYKKNRSNWSGMWVERCTSTSPLPLMKTVRLDAVSSVRTSFSQKIEALNAHIEVMHQLVQNSNLHG